MAYSRVMAETDPGTADAPQRRSGPKRAALNVARPLVGYFDRRFQELHDHVERLQVGRALDERLDHLVSMTAETREEVAADADVVAELAFTLERFADLFTARMDDAVEKLTWAHSAAEGRESRMVELPFAYGAASRLPVGARVATVDPVDPRLPVTLASLGLQVTAVEVHDPIGHPNVVTVDEPVERWDGPSQPLDAIFAISAVAALGVEGQDATADLDRRALDLFRKWLAPSGVLVLTLPYGSWAPGPPFRTYDDPHLDELLADWAVEERRVIERVDDGTWMVADPVDARRSPRTGVALVRAVARS